MIPLYQLHKEDNLSFNHNKRNKKPLYKTPKFIISLLLIIIIILAGFEIYSTTRLASKIEQRNILATKDIGGTNARMSLLNMTKDLDTPPEVIDSTKLSSFDFDSVEDLFRFYLKDKKDKYPLYAVVGIPGPIRNNTVLDLPNIPKWSMTSGDELAKKLGLKKMVFLNDFTCNSYGIQTNLKKGIDYVVLNDVPTVKDGPKLVIGPGTGLGIGFLIKSDKDEYYTIGGSEGGHSDFTPKTEKTFKLKEFVLNELKLKCVSLERCCAGPALIPMYKFLYLYENKTIDRDMELAKLIDNLKDYSQNEKVNEINKQIVSKGLSGKCKLSKKVLELFVEIFGDVAGNVSMITLPTNGVYLVGGMTLALETLITNTKIFMEHFINKDSYEYLLKSFPVYLVKNPNIGLIGAAECARRLLVSEN